ncbi:MAG: nitrilase-related carbon-nitrogen hydrolase, partial [Sphingopyxis terrae]|uniref:nitrilase-related carbon-nitrogen hydrolase n=1 Tax=Sphingopyxis terrae TaxID=33052 RepID=UPI003F7E238D
QPAEGRWHQEIAAIAAEAGLAILYGHPERSEGRVFNTATLVDRDGTVLARHRKTHLFGDLDRAVFAPGDALSAIADLDGTRVGVLICYDVEFPEAVRALALAGVDLVAVPTALMRPEEIVARTLVPARAYENQVYVAYANRIGTEGDLDYCGESCVVAPDGEELARAGTEEALLLADDLAARKAALVHGDVSPKNILVGADGPVFLDAECAVYGDPAFDLAFCTTHLLLKAVWLGNERLGEAATALVEAYRAGIDWEDADALALRAGKLTAALLLARVEGKSPAPYLTDPHHKQIVRDQARALLLAPTPIDALVANWKRTKE